MTKYQQVIRALYQEHDQELTKFQVIHDKYMNDQKKWQDEFNRQGLQIMDILHGYEKQLCGKSERSGMGMYSSRLAEKFWEEVKKKLPMIDFVGVKIG